MELNQALLEIKNGNRKSFSKLLTEVSNFDETKIKILLNSYLHLDKYPFIVGLCGTPGSGKSTFLSHLCKFKQVKKLDNKLGLLLIDPANPLNQGAILGDRIRLSDFYLEENIYIRSISNGGKPSNLNQNLSIFLMIFSHFPFEMICIETVGGGQANTEIADYVDHIVLMFDPYSGDSVQHLKSGVLDIANDIIISKADLTDTKSVENSLTESVGNIENKHIFSFNLSKPQIFDKYFFDLFSKKQTLSKSKILKSYLWHFSEEKFKKIFDKFYLEFSQKNELSDNFAQDFLKKFYTFFVKYY